MSIYQWVPIFFLSFYLLSNLYTQHGAQTHNPKVKSHMLFWLSQPGTPGSAFFKWADQFKPTEAGNGLTLLSQELLILGSICKASAIYTTIS